MAALALVERRLPTAAAPLLRAELQHLKGRILTHRGPTLGAHELLVSEGEAVAAVDPSRASTMLADAAYAAIAGGEALVARATARRARELAASDQSIAQAELALGTAMLLGDDETEGARLLRTALDRALADEGASTAAASTAVLALFELEDHAAAARLLDLLVDSARRTGDPRLAQWLDTSAAVLTARGRWSAAEARSREALRIARERGLHAQSASCLTTLANIAARRGRERECRRLATEALATPNASELVFVWASSALGLLELGLGDLPAAIVALEELVDEKRRPTTWDVAMAYACAYVAEAYVGLRRRDEAARMAATLEELARKRPRPTFLALAARSRGLVAPSGESEQHFEAAFEQHERTDNPFGRAHTELLFGVRLRRARRRTAARTHLRAALATFGRLGATSWAERARRELDATTGRSTSEQRLMTDLLTPQELAVATLVARGLRNDEVAARLYVSRRTVEYHLTNVYGKLEIGSRTQLVARLTTP